MCIHLYCIQPPRHTAVSPQRNEPVSAFPMGWYACLQGLNPQTIFCPIWNQPCRSHDVKPACGSTRQPNLGSQKPSKSLRIYRTSRKGNSELVFGAGMAKKGYFILTDISGYTEFLTESELEHAHEALQTLFDAQLANIKFPLKISGFRGDAIFIYTPEACFVNPQTFLETLENLYIVFADTLRQMQFNTTCGCRACKNIGKLDLKMCIHYG